MLDNYYTLEQNLRKLQAQDEFEDQIDDQTDRRERLQAEARFDGICCLPPREPENWDYWHAYQQGLRHYWVKELGRALESEF